MHRLRRSLPVILELDDPGWDPVRLVHALEDAGIVYALESPGAPEDLERRTFVAWKPEYEVVLVRGEVRVYGAASGMPAAGRTSVLKFLRQALRREGAYAASYAQGFIGGFVGFVSYDFKNQLEVLPDTVLDDLQTPELRLGFVRRVVAWDHKSNRVRLTFNHQCRHKRARDDYAEAWKQVRELHDDVSFAMQGASSSRDEPGLPQLSLRSQVRLRSNLDRHRYERMLARCKEHILAGDIYQANLSHRFSSPYHGSGSRLYETLRQVNPSPFACYLRFPEQEIISCSPERLVRLSQGHVETRPIAGTRPRGTSQVADRQFEHDLLASEKERAEHLMIVDMARNDIGRVCDLGSVRVESFMHIERYSHVRHLVSNVVGQLKNGQDALSLLAAVFPGASITGVPKVRCMQIIDDLEEYRRGVYSGAALYLGLDGSLDANILIRTFYLQDGKAYFSVGGGIVYDSDAEHEYEETLAKGRALQKALLIASARQDHG